MQRVSPEEEERRYWAIMMGDFAGLEPTRLAKRRAWQVQWILQACGELTTGRSRDAQGDRGPGWLTKLVEAQKVPVYRVQLGLWSVEHPLFSPFFFSRRWRLASSCFKDCRIQQAVRGLGTTTAIEPKRCAMWR